MRDQTFDIWFKPKLAEKGLGDYRFIIDSLVDHTIVKPNYGIPQQRDQYIAAKEL